jgi:thiamine biosynthesis lipoprotein
MKSVSAVTVPALLLAALLLAGCRQEQPVYNSRFLAFGTLVDLSIIGVNKDTAQRASRALEEDFAFMTEAWHPWEPGPLARVNRLLARGEPFAAPPSILPMIKLGKRYAGASDNLFNPAIGKLMDIWGFHTDTPDCHPPPPPAAVDALVRSRPVMDDIELNGIMLRGTNPDLRLDFRFLAKGYGIDLAIARLKEMGVHNAMVNAGGDLRAIGDRDGQPWRIAIRRPPGGVFAVIEIAGDESVFTAADYEHNFVFEGKNYHPILDPRTGYPAEGVRSVTVVHGDAATADAAAAALFVAGPTAWPGVASRMGVRYVLMVDDTGTVHMTPAMAKRTELVEKTSDIRLSDPL